MPIHIRAEPGLYAEACLLPGDPLRAQYIAETYLDNVQQRNSERGLLGYTGEWEGKPVSVQGTGMGCPGATIVFEELVQLGVKKLLRVGTCGGLQPHHQLGDLIVALSAVPADATAFDMRGAELSHHGGECSFEAFLRRYDLDDPVLWSIARIVHAADLDDERYDAPEAPGLDALLRGLSMVRPDHEVLALSAPLYDGLYEYLTRASMLGREPA